MKIGIDLDNVLNNLIYKWLEVYNQENNDHLTINDIKNWDIHKFTKNGKGVYKYLTNQLFEHLTPLPNAVEVTRKLQKYHDLFVITASYPKTLETKTQWLEKYFPHIPYSNVFVCQRKDLVNVDLLIDDAPHNIISFPGDVIVMDYPWNRTVGDKYFRVKDWGEIYRYLINK